MNNKNTMTLSWREPTKLNPVRYKITYGAHKEFNVSQGVLQKVPFRKNTILVNSYTNKYKIEGLMPFTSYQVNVTAIPADESFRPPAKITVMTAMAAPKPMVKPDSLGSPSGAELTVMWPQASEEYGPINHYYLVIIPEQKISKFPDEYTLEELLATPLESYGPYIAAKFLRKTIPFTFTLGDNKKYGGFVNRRLNEQIKYKIFVRAVVDSPRENLYTSSPFSEPLSLSVNNEPTNYVNETTEQPQK